MKTRPSKTRILIWRFIPIINYFIYHHQKELFEEQNSLGVLKLLRILNYRVLFTVLSDEVLFKILSYRVLFRILGNRGLFRVISDRIFFQSSAIFSSSRSYSFLIKADFLIHIIFLERTSHSTICLTDFNRFNKNDSGKHEEILAL